MYRGNDDMDEDDSSAEDQEIEDRPYTRSEIQKMFNAAQDIRV
jgi:hypothetical protein